LTESSAASVVHEIGGLNGNRFPDAESQHQDPDRRLDSTGTEQAWSQLCTKSIFEVCSQKMPGKK